MATSHPNDAVRPDRRSSTDTDEALDNRVEDEQILSGRADYVTDPDSDDAYTMMLVRSVYPHARIDGIDTSEALAHEACELVLTGADVRDRANPMPSPIDAYDEYPLATDKATYVGEPLVAVVVAGDRYVAEDVGDLVSVDYDRLEPVSDPVEAASDDVIIHEDAGSNVAADETLTFGDPERVFADAEHVVERSFSWGRISGVPLETAGVTAAYDAADDTFTIESNIQLHTLVNQSVCATLGYPESDVDLRVPAHVGGSFGTKIDCVTRYCCLAALAARELRHPVEYVEDRIENLQGGDAHSSDREYTVRLALDADGRMQALDVSFVDDFGAYPRYAINQTLKPIAMATGAYEIEHVRYDLTAVLTNKTSQAPYRGFGVPPHNFALESIVDVAARELRIDATDLRSRNVLTPDQFPYQLPTRNVYDSGDYPAALDALREHIESERDPGGLLHHETVAAKRADGKYRGVKPTVLVEPGVTQSDWRDYWDFDGDELAERSLDEISHIPEHLRAEVHPDGTLTASLATDSAGQGHQTLLVQLLASELGVPPDDIRVDYLGSAEAPTDYGSAASRLGVMLSGAATGLAATLAENLELLAAEVWDCDPTDVEYEEGTVVRRDGRATLRLADLAQADAEREPSRTSVRYDYDHPAITREEYTDALQQKLPVYATAAFAANAPIVEVDIETGQVEILKFYSVRDCGTRLNPTIVEGQEHGGVAQGVGAALFEEFGYDEEAQPLATTLFDYTLPSIDRVPEMDFEYSETRSPFTETGAKGVGECGITDAPASIACSVNAALAPIDAVVDSIPITPEHLRGKVTDLEGAE
jgi:carbon-monoxide dehydrogenase large subunit